MSEWTTEQIGDLSGKVAVVTGANSGLGLEITRVLAGHGAHVIMACRNQEKATAAAQQVRAEVADARLELVTLDLADLASVGDAAAHIAAHHTAVDLLVNNAGLMAVDDSRTADGFETQFGVNHLGHFAFTADLWPVVKAAPGARIASMSSMGHRPGRMDFDNLNAERKYRRWPAYFQSKLANLLFTAELDRRLRAAGADVIAVAAHPGGTRTDLGSEGSGVLNKGAATFSFLAQPVRIGALPMLRALTAPDVQGGQYYGCRFMALGGPVLEKPSARARSAADARRLWTVSEELTGRTFDPSA